MTRARLYGRVQGNGSLAVVTEGFRKVLDEAALLAGVCPLDVAEGLEPDPVAGASARHGIYTGPLGQVERMFRRGVHEQYWIMVAPNSNRLPPDLVAMLTGLQEKCPRRVHLMAPSGWATDVVNKHFAGDEGSCLTVPHGVDTAYYKVNVSRAEEMGRGTGLGEFRVLHFSTSAQQRKGTLELIQAWKRLETLWDPSRATLLCVMDRSAQEALMGALFDADLALPSGVRISPRADLTPQAMAQNLAWSHVVCQPSRGEAFGLIPLQALCCGVPVVATDCTGHSEYLGQGGEAMGCEIVETGGLVAIDDLPGAKAPGLDCAEVARALLAARRRWSDLQGEALKYAPDWQRLWSWKEKLGPFVERIRTT